MLPHFNKQQQSSILNEQLIRSTLKKLGIVSCLKQANFQKRSGIVIFDAIFLLVLLAFGLGTNISSFFKGKYSDNTNTSKSALYEILKKTSYNWRKLLNLLSVRCISKLHKETPNKPKFFTLDDSPIYRDSSSKSELLSRIYDHSKKYTFKGFLNFCLTWTDGISHIPVDFSLSASKNIVSPEDDKTETFDKRSLSYKRRIEAKETKIKVALDMVKRAIQNGVVADYLLFDSWFCYNCFIKDISDLGIHVICMAKSFNANKYYLPNNPNKKFYLKQLVSKYANSTKKHVLGSMIVKTSIYKQKVKLVFIRNPKNPKSILTLLSTDINLDEETICLYYANRWGIECNFKTQKQYLGLEKGCQARSFDVVWAHTTLVYIRLLILQWIYREKSDTDKETLGEIFYHISESNKFIGVIGALEYLYSHFPNEVEKILKKYIKDPEQLKQATKEIVDLLTSYLETLPKFIKQELKKHNSKLFKALQKLQQDNPKQLKSRQNK